MESLRLKVKESLPRLVEAVNCYLRGEKYARVRKYVAQLEPSKVEPSWLRHFAASKRPERTDGKSLGTYVEKLLKAEISRFLGIPITGSSASGVDIPELSLNTKATSDRQPQSSEPFHSAYDRVLGAKFDIIVCIYNGKDFFRKSSSPLQIQTYAYLERTEVADARLCATAKRLQQLVRESQLDVPLAKRALRAIVYADKSGPRASLFRELEKGVLGGDTESIRAAVIACEHQMPSERQVPMPDEEEWESFKQSSLNGKIGISFALQWRYQFSALSK